MRTKPRLGAGLETTAAFEDHGGNQMAARASLSTRLLDLAERVVVVIAFLGFYLANSRSPHALNMLVVAGDGLTVWFVIFRQPARSISRSPYDWTIAVVGTVCGLFMRPGGVPLIDPAAAAGVVVSGCLLTIAAKLSLNRSFGIAPANRGIKVRGAYAFVRHPMYLGYLMLQAAFLLLNYGVFNLLLLIISTVSQFARIIREERFLGRDPEYRRYSQQVRFRMIPYVF